jgi:hypothetical protein
VKEKKKLCSWFPSVNAYEAFERDLALIKEDATMPDCSYLRMLSSSGAALCSDMVCSLRLQRKKDRLGYRRQLGQRDQQRWSLILIRAPNHVDF